MQSKNIEVLEKSTKDEEIKLESLKAAKGSVAEFEKWKAEHKEIDSQVQTLQKQKDALMLK